MAAPPLLFAPFLLGRQVLYWGAVVFQFYPWREFARQSLLSGHLPLWNPLLGNGAPLLANYQSAVLYPPNWLGLLLPTDFALAWLAALHLAWAGIGMVLLAKTLGFTPFGQAVAGLAFGLSQYLVARVGFFSINAAAAWLPWLVWAADTQLRLGEAGAPALRLRLRAAFWLALFSSLLLLAGHAQIAWYSLLMTGVWVMWRLLSSTLRPAGTRLAAAGWLVAPLIVALLLAAAQLLPTAELLRESPRAVAAGFDFVMNYSFSPWRLLSLLAPDVLGNPARGQFFGYGNYWEDAVYVGVLPLLLALGAVASAIRSTIRRPAVFPPQAGLPIFLTVVACISLLLALGRNTPVFPFLYWNAPTFNLFQAPTRIMLLFVFALALLAGLGASQWPAWPPKGRALYWTRLGAAGAVAMTLVSLAAWLAVPANTQVGAQLQTIARAFTLTGALLFAVALLSLLRPANTSRGWELAAAALISVDLLYAGIGLNPGAPPDLYRHPPATAASLQPALGSHRLFYSPEDDYQARYDTFLSFKTFGPPELAYGMRESLLANSNMLSGIASANNSDPLISARYADLVQVISQTKSLSLLRLMDIAVVASPNPHEWEEVAASDGGVRFYRVPGEPRRIWQPDNAQVVPDAAAALAALADASFDPALTVILEADDHPEQPPQTLGPLSPAALELTVTFEDDGWLVVSDTYYPGWVVAVDGVPSPILHGDYAFRVVAVPAGTHAVVFDYQPRSVRLGLWLSSLGLLTLALLALSAWRWPNTSAQSAP